MLPSRGLDLVHFLSQLKNEKVGKISSVAGNSRENLRLGQNQRVKKGVRES